MSYKPSPQTEKKLKLALRIAIADTAGLFRREMRRVLAKKGRGEVYFEHGVRHRASAPGQAPAIQTGGYRATVRGDRSKLDDANPSMKIGTGAMVGAYFEFGTPTMAPRPHWIPTFNRMRERLLKRAAATYKRQLRRPA